MTDDDIFISEEDVAKRLSIPLKSLRDRRARGLDIPYVRLGKRQIRYHWPTVRDYFLNKALTKAGEKSVSKSPYVQAFVVPVKQHRGGRPRLPV